MNARTGDVAPKAVEKGTAFITGGHTGLIVVDGLSNGAQVQLEFPEKTIYLKASDGSTLMLDSFVENSEESSLDDGHDDDIRIGAKLHIPADYKVTTYTGSIPVNIIIVK